jgi:hypothetical protein
MFINILLIWSIFEFTNWINYIFIYFKLLKTTKKSINEKQINNYIDEIKNCNKNEIENIIISSISYEKNILIKKNYENLENLTISLTEINYIIKKYMLCNKLEYRIDEIREIIENKLNIKFIDSNNNNNYIINEWGQIFIYFTFIPLFLSLFLNSVSSLIHYYMIYFLKFKYEIFDNNSLGILHNSYDPNKKTILFIHGFGFGYIPYINSLIQLQKNYNLIIIILPNISSYLYSSDILFDDHKIINLIYNFIKKYNYNELTILSHSFGTLISHMLMNDKRSKIIKKNVSIDPVYFFINYYKTQKYAQFPCYNKTNFILYLFDSFINYLIYDSIYLKYICYRYLCGPKYWIYKYNNFNKYIFIFHKHDYVINAESIYDKIKNETDSYFFGTTDSTHGTILFSNKLFYKLIEIIEK